MAEVLIIKRGGRPRKDIPIDLCLSLRAQGYSYDMIAWKLNQMGYDVSRWTVMRRLKDLEEQHGPV